MVVLENLGAVEKTDLVERGSFIELSIREDGTRNDDVN